MATTNNRHRRNTTPIVTAIIMFSFGDVSSKQQSIYIFFKSCTRSVIGIYRQAWCLSNNLAKILTVKVIFLFVKKKCTFKYHYNAYCLEYEYIYIPNLHWFSALMVPTQWQEPFEHTAPEYPPHSPRVKQRSPSSASANLNNRRLTCFLNHIYQRKNCHNVVFVSSVVGFFFFKNGFNKRKCNFGFQVSF